MRRGRRCVRSPRPWPSLAARGSRRRLEADPARPQAAQHAARRDAAAQAHRAARSSPATRCRRWPTPRTRSSSCCRSPASSAYAWSLEDRRSPVAIVMLTVVASYRQNVHAYPSGGGDYEVATVNLGPTAGVTVASALLVDYVLTVAVSISSGVQNAASAIAVRVRARGDRAPCVLVLVLAALNLRGVRESGDVLRHPDLRLHGRRPRDGALRAVPRRSPATLPDVESADLTSIAGARLRGPDHHGRAGLPAGAGVLLGLCGADRRRGDLQRRAGVPQAEEPQRRDHAAAARRDRGHDAAEHHRAGQRDGPEVRRPATTSTGSRRPTAARSRRATTSTR